MKRNSLILIIVGSIPVIIFLIIIYFAFKLPTPMKVYEFDMPKSELQYLTKKFKEENLDKYSLKDLDYNLDGNYRKEVIKIGQNEYIYVVYDFEEIQLLGWVDPETRVETSKPEDLYTHPQEVALFEKEVIDKIQKPFPKKRKWSFLNYFPKI